MSVRTIFILLCLTFPMLISAQKKSQKRQLKKYKAEGVERSISTKGVKPNTVITTAKSYMGTRHKMGGTSYKGLDCSGLIMVSFARHGIKLPRVSSEQGRYGRQVWSVKKLKKGDLLFFHMNWNRKRLVNHVGLYLGNGRFIHVSSSKGCVISSLDSPVWQEGFLFGTRVW